MPRWGLPLIDRRETGSNVERMMKMRAPCGSVLRQPAIKIIFPRRRVAVSDGNRHLSVASRTLDRHPRSRPHALLCRGRVSPVRISICREAGALGAGDWPLQVLGCMCYNAYGSQGIIMKRDGSPANFDARGHHQTICPVLNWDNDAEPSELPIHGIRTHSERIHQRMKCGRSSTRVCGSRSRCG